ncbi:procollagen galactosyltransferase 1-A-like [Centruroides sculpturatus]|uniref:procollagen galactosyltransferase 1-A-like n=1 Tax=Centruroides sculpturatus TaxID=218467 RepID=UPI000C6CCD1D|nr:procollagen galactosyltransferase 1-A-like [Centruroides sculpturatus]XP_023218836.1 procollagen galactosyltransferase 1-A-like [Centruroides sculpturatus]
MQMKTSIYIIILILSLSSYSICQMCHNQESFMAPTVMVAILARNKEHTLPHFLGYLERLNYPKHRMSLWIRSDHNIDKTAEMLQMWVAKERNKYHKIDIEIDETTDFFSDEDGVFDWSLQHFAHVIQLRESALETARQSWADYLFFIDCDAFIVNNETLNELIAQQKTIVAPMLESLRAYSNYWCGMTSDGYYKRTNDYMPILEREKIGCFDVPMVHSAVLINLRHKQSLKLTYDLAKLANYTGPIDDIIIFANSAKHACVSMNILNKEAYGYILAPLENENTLKDDIDQLINLRLEVMVEDPPLYVSPHLRYYVPEKKKSKLGFDEVYLINLKRRTERRERMLRSLNELGIETKLLDAVDGKQLNHSIIKEMGIKMLPEYTDPYHKRPMTMGEIGCFLSHYKIWEEIVKKQYRSAIIFEDDIRFESYFRRKLSNLLKEARGISLQWDLIYLGRKRLLDDQEPYIEGTTTLVRVAYSYWTLCYMITLEGARKLIAGDPLSKLVPVDEYLPIMFNRHPETVWKSYYPERNLRAYSAHPLLVYPTHYTGEDKYISDTEDSEVLSLMRDEL